MFAIVPGRDDEEVVVTKLLPSPPPPLIRLLFRANIVWILDDNLVLLLKLVITTELLLLFEELEVGTISLSVPLSASSPPHVRAEANILISLQPIRVFTIGTDGADVDRTASYSICNARD